MMSEHGQDFDGMRNFLEKYLFISDDTIELQMFQEGRKWSLISQGVLGSNFITLHTWKVSWAGNPAVPCQNPFSILSCRWLPFTLLTLSWA